VHFKGKGRINYANSHHLRRFDGAGHDSESRLPTSTAVLARLMGRPNPTNTALSTMEGQRKARAALVQ
jgi:hypothetical protein